MLDSESEPATPMPTEERLQEDLPQNNGGIYQAEQEDSEYEDEDLGEPQLQNEDSDSNPSSDDDEDLEQDEFTLLPLSELRKSVQCPICLGIIRKTRTVKECLHRFCRECVDKSMRMGNRECPACRTHCASRRSLSDDPKYDALVAMIFPNIEQYEEEELALNEEEDARKKQIQALISQTFERQSEALTKKRKRSKSSMRRRISYRSDDNDAANGNSSSAEERHETRPKRCRRSKGQQSTPAVACPGGGQNENNLEVNRATVCAIASGGLVGSPEMLAWGRGGMRSHTRYPRNGRLSRLADHLRHLDGSPEMAIQIILVSLDAEKAQVLQQPYLCCKPTLSVRQICQFIAFQTSSQADDIEMLAVKELNSKISSLICSEVQPPDSLFLNACKDELQPLNADQTLEEVKSAFNLRLGHLILAYRQRQADPRACNEAVAGHRSS